MNLSPAEDDRAIRRLRAYSVVLFVVASAALLSQAGDPFWLDELHTVWCARGSLEEVSERAALGNQTAPYFVVQGLTGRLFGFGPYAMRALSALAGAAASVVAFRFVARTSRSLPLAATIGCAPLFWPTLSFYFVEARPYSLVYFAATLFWTKLAETLSPDAFEQRSDEPDSAMRRRLLRSRLAWSIALAGAIWLHPTALLLAAPAVVALLADLWRAESRRRYSFRARAFDLALVALLCLPATPLFRTLYERRGAWAAFIRSPHVLDWADHFALIAFAIPLIAAAGAAWIERATRKEEAEKPASNASDVAVRSALFAAAFAIPVLIASVATWTDAARLYHFRYLIGAVAALPLFAGAALATIRRRPLQNVAAAIFLAALVWTSGGSRELAHKGRIVPDSRQEDWQGLAERLAAAPRGPIVLDGGIIESKRWRASDRPEEREYLAFPLRAFPSLAERYVESISYDWRDGVDLSDETAQRALDAGRLYAIVRGSSPESMKRRLRGQNATRGDAEPTVESFGQLWLLTYEFPAPRDP